LFPDGFNSPKRNDVLTGIGNWNTNHIGLLKQLITVSRAIACFAGTEQQNKAKNRGEVENPQVT